jgi:hypothetical protein
MISIGIILIFILFFLTQNKHNQFTIFSLAALYPFTFGKIASFPNILVIEWLTIVVVLVLVNDLVSLKTIKKKYSNINFKGIGIFIFALIILIIWIFISYFNNEIFSHAIINNHSSGIRRTYFGILNNILIFFVTVIFFISYNEQISIEKLLKTILTITIIIGIIRAFTFQYDINTPLLAGGFAYNPSKYGSYQRFAGLDVVGLIGVPTVFSLYIYKTKLNIITFIILLIFIFLSGGRATLIGMVISVIIFSLVFFPKNLIYLTIGIAITFIAGILFLPESYFTGQLERFSTLQQSGFMGMDEWRGTAWLFFIKNFQASPIFGKGIGDYVGFIYSSAPDAEEFTRNQLFAGGHGSYLSLLSTLGIGGLFYFIIMLFGGIVLSFKNIRLYKNKNIQFTSLSVFVFMLLLNASITFIVGFNGLTDVQFMFFMVGLICGLRLVETNYSEKYYTNHSIV